MALVETGLFTPAGDLLGELESAASNDAIFISCISLLEVVHAVRRGRIHLAMSLEAWFRATLRQPGVRVIELSPAIALATLSLPAEFPGDPADRLIAATARVEQLALCTHDRALLRFSGNGLFETREINPDRNST